MIWGRNNAKFEAYYSLPPEDVWVALSSDTKAEFKILRKDVQDLVQASNVLLGLSIFETFVNLALRSIDDQVGEFGAFVATPVSRSDHAHRGPRWLFAQGLTIPITQRSTTDSEIYRRLGRMLRLLFTASRD